MSYTSNPHIGKTRRNAVRDVHNGSPVAAVARYYGVHRATIHRWIKRASKHSCEYHQTLDTRSSAPKKSANKISDAVVDRIKQIRSEHHRCAPVIHAQLKKKVLW